jgi:hypothetical protein
MTTLGKLFVLLNVGLSLAMGFWGYAIYSTRIDWSNTAAKGDKPAGALVAKVNRVKELGDALRTAEESWNSARETVAALERDRPINRAWYAKELEFLRSGASAQDAARVVLLDKTPPADANATSRVGQVLINVADPYKRPRLQRVEVAPGVGLKSSRAYQEEIKSLVDECNAQNDKLDGLIAKEVEYSDQLAGGTAKYPKGLQTRVEEEKTKRTDLLEEQTLLRPLLVNAVVESEQVFKRQRALEARIKELEKTGVAAR